MRRLRAKRAAEKKRRYNNPKWRWFAPKDVMAAVRKGLGGRIDLDPASEEVAQTVVRATKYLTIDDDGLIQEWHGNVYVNPPYSGNGVIHKWIDKLLEEIASGRVKQAILLVNAQTGTKWFRKAAEKASEICYTGRIRFWRPPELGATNTNSPAYAQAVLYFGDNPSRFRSAFKRFDNLPRVRM
jgi:phage N-6-adenine-methyltransferase